MNFEDGSQGVAALFGLEPQLRDLLTSVTSYRFIECELTPVLVGALGKIPSLRRVEVSYTEWEDEEQEAEEEEDEDADEAPQVVEVAIVCRNYSRDKLIWNPSRLVRFFPNADFVSIDIDVCNWLYTVRAAQLVETIPPTLRTLKVRNRVDDEYQYPAIDELLSRFSHLQHLHLDPALYAFETLCDNLPSVENLVSLSLGFSNNLFHPNDLVEALKQHPHLRVVSFEYFGITEGAPFDMELAEAQAEEIGFDVKNDDALPALRVVDDLSDMEGWDLSFGYDPVHVILEVFEMEEEIKKLGFFLSSNLEEVLRALHRHLVEFFNRGIGELYFYHSTEGLDHALRLARLHNLTLPLLEIDLKNQDLPTRDKLEWFKVDMTEAIGDGGKECYALNLRYKGDFSVSDARSW
jgi:hypothetical protein